MTDERVVTKVFAGSADVRPVGPYTATITFFRRDSDVRKEPPLLLEIEADDLPGLALSLERAHASIQRRRISDAVCGDHKACGNTRMVRVRKPGRPDKVLEHCPRCEPLLAAAMERGVMPR